MEYMSAKQASEKWGIHMRNVQTLCANGRVQGAMKFERSWLIPKDTKKPTDPRKNPAYKAQKNSPYIPYLLFVDRLSCHPGEADKILIGLDEEESRHAECTLDFMRGKFGKAKQLYLDTSKSSKLWLCAMNLAWYEAATLGNLELFSSINKNLVELQKKSENDEVLQLVVEISSNIWGYGLKTKDAPWTTEGLHLLPYNTKKCYFFANAYYDLLISKNYQRVAYGLDTYLNGQHDAGYNPRDIFLHLFCGTAYNAMGQPEKAREFAEKALDLALPDGFIFPFTRFTTIFGNTLTECIKKRGTDVYTRIIELGEKMYQNYVTMHNRVTKNNVSTLLTIHEIGLAQLVVAGHTNEKIAEMLGCSVAAVKQRLGIIFEKLEISKRGEIVNYILY